MLISPELLRDRGLLSDHDLTGLPEFENHRVDYDRAVATKLPLLKKACETFKATANPEQRQEFETFCQEKGYWLEDFALYMSLKDTNDGASWYTWEPEIARRDPEALDLVRRKLPGDIFFHKYLQFEFFRQWSNLKHHANYHGIQIVGDIPIYVAHDSADVWSNPEIFALDEETGEAALMAGVPPDYFSATGQLWGNPVYQWDYLQKTNFKWWIQRFHAMLDYVDLIRIDHFRGFEAYWVVEQGEETAINGTWVEAPGVEFFETLGKELGSLPILAEDLGVITPEVEALRDRFEFPGMKILQFAFGSGPGNPFLPFNYYTRNCVVYTGTHDNDTTMSWFNQLPDWERDALMRYLGHVSPDGIHWDLIRLALSSIANQAIIPMQDLLGLNTDARMNFPGKAEGNWEWRYVPGSLSDWLCDRLRTLTETYGRAPAPRN